MSAVIEELYSLLVPLASERLLVPRACVAEVVRYSRPTEPGNAPPWYLGQISWTGRELPLMSFEAALGAPVPELSGRTRVVIFYATTGGMNSRYFGLVTQGFPQLVRVNREVLKLDEHASWIESAPVICQVRMINEYPLIPDLERVEAMLASV